MVDVERILLERNVPIPLRDGTMTYANVWRPAGGGPVPAIMVRTPYTKEVEEINVFSEPRVAAARGFAIVSQDVRGRGYSEGEFDPYFQEGLDGYDSIEHVAGLDWCSGDVFMAGNSYVGATQWLAAVEAPPSLRAIAPGLTPDAYDEGWTFHSGVLELAFIHSWIAGIFGPQDRLWLDDVERSYGARDELIAFAPWCEPWFREEIGSPYWERCSIAARRDRVRIPALSIGGWHDTFLDGTLRNFAADRTRARACHRAVGARRLADAPGWRPQPRRRRLRRRIRALRARARVLLGGDRRRGSADGAGHRLHARAPAGGSSSSRGRRPVPSPSRCRSPGRRSITTPRACRPAWAGGSSRSTRRAAPDGAGSTSGPSPPILVCSPWSSARRRRNGWRARCAPAWRPIDRGDRADWVCTLCMRDGDGALLNLCEGIARAADGRVRGQGRPREHLRRAASPGPSSACSSPGRATRAGSRSGSSRRQTVGAGSTLDLTAAGDV